MEDTNAHTDAAVSGRSPRRFRFHPFLSIFLIPIFMVVGNVLYYHADPSMKSMLYEKEMQHEMILPRSEETVTPENKPRRRPKRNDGPRSYKDCCYLPFQRSNREEGFKTCKAVCLTKAACNPNSTFPFRTAHEKAYFRLRRKGPKIFQYMKKTCQGYQAHTPPSNKWCSETPLQGKYLLHRHGMGCLTGSFMHMYVFPKGNLLYCGIPKVGITQWLQFLRFYVGARDYQSFPHFKPDIELFKFNDLPPHRQMEIIQSKNWTKAVFIRNPAERLLSAYLDKIQGKLNTTMTFEEFVSWIETPNAPCPYEDSNRHVAKAPGLNWCTDPHWRPQVWSCGLSDYLSEFSLVGNFHHTASQTKLLLQKVDMWESHGKHYRTAKMSRAEKKKKSICSLQPPPRLKKGETAVGFQQVLGKNGTDGADVHGHAKYAKARFDEYYTPELLERVKKLYSMDYDLWNILEQQEGASGKELAEQFCSRKQ